MGNIYCTAEDLDRRGLQIRLPKVWATAKVLCQRGWRGKVDVARDAIRVSKEHVIYGGRMGARNKQGLEANNAPWCRNVWKLASADCD